MCYIGTSYSYKKGCCARDSVFTGSFVFTGASGNEGRLSDDEARQMKRYQSELCIFNDPEEVSKIVRWAEQAFPTTT